MGTTKVVAGNASQCVPTKSFVGERCVFHESCMGESVCQMTTCQCPVTHNPVANDNGARSVDEHCISGNASPTT